MTLSVKCEEMNKMTKIDAQIVFRSLFLIFIIFVISNLWHPIELNAQSLTDRDLSQIRVETFTDEQLQRYLRQAEGEGYSVDEILLLSKQRGLPDSQIQLLGQRLRELRRKGLGIEENELTASEESTDDERNSLTDESRMKGEDDESAYMQRPKRYESLEEKRVFGSKIFREEYEALMPNDIGPVPSSYTLGAGDELSVYIWGSTTYTYNLDVSREGTVRIENLAPVFVGGLSIEEANKRIIGVLEGIYVGLKPDSSEPATYAQVSLSRLRTIQVQVVGQVHNPGSYQLNALSNVFHALYKSGGPDFKGTYRNIKLVRDGATIDEIDLYEFLSSGSQDQWTRLRDNDVILVGPYLNRVDVVGEMKRTGFFELKEGESFQHLLNFSGGFNEDAYTESIRIERNNGMERRIDLVQQGEFESFTLFGGDRVTVEAILDRYENRVSIKGAVWREGVYPLTEGLTVKGLIELAKGLKPEALLSRGVIDRLSPSLQAEQISFNVQKVLDNPEAFDLPLQREDVVNIFKMDELRYAKTVIIEGAVRRPGRYPFRENMTIEDLILKAAGFNDAASNARIEISRRIIGDDLTDIRGDKLAETYSISIDQDLGISDEDKVYRLEAFDRVFVHRRPDYSEQQTVSIEGEVLYPGTYVIRDRKERISSIIERAGGITKEAFIQGARLSRLIEAIDRADVKYTFLQGEDSLSVDLNNGNDLSEEGEELEVAEEDKYRRIGIDLESAMDDTLSTENLVVMNGDIIRIPQQLETVRIAGGVLQEAEVRFRSGLKLEDYVALAGGFAQNAAKNNAYVIYPNGDVAGSGRRFLRRKAKYPDIQPGSEIIIPLKPEKVNLSTAEVISVSTAVVSMLATLTLMINQLRP